jgi:hypothetical protein
MNLFLNLRIRDYGSWSLTAVDKIIKCIDTSSTIHQFESCNKMIDNFIMLSIVNSQMSDDQIRSISFQLKTYLDIKKA